MKRNDKMIESLDKIDNLYEVIKKADSGDLEAQYKAARYILHELELAESDQDIINRAIKYLRNAAMSGYYHGIAAEELGSLYYNGHHVNQDYKQAIIWYRTAAQKRQPIAYYGLGKCFYNGNGVEKDFTKAFDSFFKGDLLGYTNNRIILGDMYKKGEFVERDDGYALKIYQSVYESEQNLFDKHGLYSDAYGIACLRLGECYMSGIGTTISIEKANGYFQTAKKHSADAHWAMQPDKTDAETARLLRLMYDAPYSEDIDYESRQENTDVDDFFDIITKGLPEYKLVYYPDSELKELCKSNPLVTKFDDTPFMDIYNGVLENDPRKMYEMAIICYQGDKSISKNPALYDYAMYLFHQSLLAGCSDPLEILGLCYYHGDTVKQSYETALFLYRLSEQPMAYGEIGVYYANGHGVEKDDLMAYQYFVKCLLFDKKRAGETYKNLAIIYPHLDCFEKDQVFLDYCQEASVKYASDQNDTF